MSIRTKFLLALLAALSLYTVASCVNTEVTPSLPMTFDRGEWPEAVDLGSTPLGLPLMYGIMVPGFANRSVSLEWAIDWGRSRAIKAADRILTNQGDSVAFTSGGWLFVTVENLSLGKHEIRLNARTADMRYVRHVAKITVEPRVQDPYMDDPTQGILGVIVTHNWHEAIPRGKGYMEEIVCTTGRVITDNT